MIDRKAHSSAHVFWLMDNTSELLDRNSGDIMLQNISETLVTACGIEKQYLLQGRRKVRFARNRLFEESFV